MPRLGAWLVPDVQAAEEQIADSDRPRAACTTSEPVGHRVRRSFGNRVDPRVATQPRDDFVEVGVILTLEFVCSTNVFVMSPHLEEPDGAYRCSEEQARRRLA